MVSTAERRLRKEMALAAEIHTDPMTPKITMVNDDLFDLRGHIPGPSETCYENGIFEIEIKVPKTFPFEPPKCRFLTKVWHPNVSSMTGAICLDILKDAWSASMTLLSMLISIQALLTAPEPKDPQDAVVARQFMDRKKSFTLTAQFWTRNYAMGHLENASMSQEVFNCYQKLNSLMSSSASTRDHTINALSKNDWDPVLAKKELN